MGETGTEAPPASGFERSLWVNTVTDELFSLIAHGTLKGDVAPVVIYQSLNDGEHRVALPEDFFEGETYRQLSVVERVVVASNSGRP